MSHISHRVPMPAQSPQKGLALVIALIVLVAMSLAGIALVRSVDTGVLIAGNLAFRQGATTAGDAGVEAARAWLLGNGTLLSTNSADDGYYATSQDALDLTGNRTPDNTGDDVRWAGATGMSDPKCLSADTAGNTVCYIIHRLCNGEGALDAATCSTQQTEQGGSSIGISRQMATYQQPSWKQVATLAYYRVTVRIAGPRNNVSFIQALLLI